MGEGRGGVSQSQTMAVMIRALLNSDTNVQAQFINHSRVCELSKIFMYAASVSWIVWSNSTRAFKGEEGMGGREVVKLRKKRLTQQLHARHLILTLALIADPLQISTSSALIIPDNSPASFARGPRSSGSNAP